MRQGETEALDDARGVITAAERKSHGTDDARTGGIGGSTENAPGERR